jgi:hypothetical protein
LIYNGFLWSFNKPGKWLRWTPRAGIPMSSYIIFLTRHSR